jgi:hypothetical protein
MITPVPAEFVEQLLRELHEKGADHLLSLLDDFEREQPVLYEFMDQTQQEGLSPQEQANLLSVGLNMWYLMAQWHRPLMKVSRRKLAQAKRTFEKHTEKLESGEDSEALITAILPLTEYPEPEVLAMVADSARRAPHPDNNRKDVASLYTVLYLRIALDALIRCRPNR